LLTQAPEPEPPAISPDLLAEVRTRLDAGITPELQQEIVRLLVARIVIHTELLPDGQKRVRAEVHYRLPAVGPTRTGTGSWRRQRSLKAHLSRMTLDQLPRGASSSVRRAALGSR